jgi:hypothetical protein
MNFIKPITITDAMIATGTSIAEPAAGETEWVSAASYTAGDTVIRTQTHRKYIALQTHSGRTTAPESDPTYWDDVGPTLRWAPFDSYISTGATATTTLTYVLNPGYFNALALYGLVGTNISITIKDAPGGSTIYSFTSPLFEDPAGWYEYLFVAPKPITKFARSNLPIRPEAELTITVTAATGQPVGIGMIVVGDLVDLVGDLAEFGGTEYGSMAEPVTYSYIKTDEFGNTTIVRRHRSTNMTAKIVLPSERTDEALRQIQEVLDVPVAWIAKPNRSGFQGLNVFGLGSARVTYESPGLSRIDLNVKGMI